VTSWWRATGTAACAIAVVTINWTTFGGSGPVRNPIPFESASPTTGFDFQHFTGATGSYFLPEIMGSGVGLIDYDGDGDLDVFVLQGAILDPTKHLTDALFPPPSHHWPGNRLFRNELIPTGTLRFVDLTDDAGVAGTGSYGMGLAVGDYDNDGRPDILVTNFGRNILYHNSGDGTFTDVTDNSGLDQESFYASAAFLDYDRDRFLDLFITRYNAFTVSGNKKCYNYAGGREYCGPGDYQALSSKLYHGDGHGHFVDVSVQAGIGSAVGNGLGVVCADFDGDGWIDIYVANDKTPNHLWINRHDGTFQEVGVMSGAAYNGDGRALSGMGVSAADFDNDGDEDIFVTNLTGEPSTLFRNNGSGMFEDVTNLYGLGQSTLAYTGFGTLWFDYDNDGRLDLFIANGEVRAIDMQRGQLFPYRQHNQLFHNETKMFQEVTSRSGPVFQALAAGRGAAFGDIDNDGDLDIVVANANGPVQLLRNQIGSRNHSLQLLLHGRDSNRDAYGAIVTLQRKGHPPLRRRVGTDGSYLSANDPRVHFGLGTDPELKQMGPLNVQITWPDGYKESWEIAQIDRTVQVAEGGGKAVK
jgi:hypothetical protein